MTTDAIGPCPPRKFLIHSDPSTRGLHWVNHDYADYWRRRALAAEGLLREAKPFVVGDWHRRVVAHFASVIGEKP